MGTPGPRAACGVRRALAPLKVEAGLADGLTVVRKCGWGGRGAGGWRGRCGLGQDAVWACCMGVMLHGRLGAESGRALGPTGDNAQGTQRGGRGVQLGAPGGHGDRWLRAGVFPGGGRHGDASAGPLTAGLGGAQGTRPYLAVGPPGLSAVGRRAGDPGSLAFYCGESQTGAGAEGRVSRSCPQPPADAVAPFEGRPSRGLVLRWGSSDVLAAGNHHVESQREGAAQQHPTRGEVDTVPERGHRRGFAAHGLAAARAAPEEPWSLQPLPGPPARPGPAPSASGVRAEVLSRPCASCCPGTWSPSPAPAALLPPAVPAVLRLRAGLVSGSGRFPGEPG